MGAFLFEKYGLSEKCKDRVSIRYANETLPCRGHHSATLRGFPWTLSGLRPRSTHAQKRYGPRFGHALKVIQPTPGPRLKTNRPTIGPRPKTDEPTIDPPAKTDGLTISPSPKTNGPTPDPHAKTQYGPHPSHLFYRPWAHLSHPLKLMSPHPAHAPKWAAALRHSGPNHGRYVSPKQASFLLQTGTEWVSVAQP